MPKIAILQEVTSFGMKLTELSAEVTSYKVAIVGSLQNLVRWEISQGFEAQVTATRLRVEGLL